MKLRKVIGVLAAALGPVPIVPSACASVGLVAAGETR